jgi:hypoxanthine-guanine phosphoribosyltransferase
MKKTKIELDWEQKSFKEQMDFLMGFGMSYKEAAEIYSEKWSELPVEIKAYGDKA